ncbi:MAG: M67 family metallopeptidase [Nitrospirota bacterium]|nr:MAG: M67 family metallopeptidase [Nitrospirota bacterium]
MEPIQIPESILNEMIEHALEGYPNEVCGLIAGRDLNDPRVLRMTNTDPSPVSYRMDPREQLIVEKEMRKNGERILAIYHSHPDSEAFPSAKDAREAYQWNWGAPYIIIGKVKDSPSVRAFYIEEGHVTEVPLETL